MSQEIQYTVQDGSVLLIVDESIYPLESIYGACYIFVDRCYVFLDRPEDKKVSIRLKSKHQQEISEQITVELESLVGEFANELLNQVLRFTISSSTGQIREYVMGRAFTSSRTQASIDALLAELDAEELEEDDLEISVPWKTE